MAMFHVTPSQVASHQVGVPRKAAVSYVQGLGVYCNHRMLREHWVAVAGIGLDPMTVFVLLPNDFGSPLRHC